MWSASAATGVPEARVTVGLLGAGLAVIALVVVRRRRSGGSAPID